MEMRVKYALQKMVVAQRWSLNMYKGLLALQDTTSKIEGVIIPMQFSLKNLGIKNSWKESEYVKNKLSSFKNYVLIKSI